MRLLCGNVTGWMQHYGIATRQKNSGEHEQSAMSGRRNHAEKSRAEDRNAPLYFDQFALTIGHFVLSL
jgi:hypothetical protein